MLLGQAEIEIKKKKKTSIQNVRLWLRRKDDFVHKVEA